MHNFYTESLPRQQLKMTDVAGVEEIKDSMLDCVVSPTSKAFPESRLRRLISLALSITTQFDKSSYLFNSERIFRQSNE